MGGTLPGRPRRRERGAAAVEFALVLPLLLLVTAGIVDFGRAFFTQISLTNAAREGVRAASLSTPTAGDVQLRAQNASPGLTVTTVPVLCPSASGNAEVTVNSTFDWLMIGPAASFFNGSPVLPNTLSAKAVMKCGG